MRSAQALRLPLERKALSFAKVGLASRAKRTRTSYTGGMSPDVEMLTDLSEEEELPELIPPPLNEQQVADWIEAALEMDSEP